jgi:hypothetical protein
MRLRNPAKVLAIFSAALALAGGVAGADPLVGKRAAPNEKPVSVPITMHGVYVYVPVRLNGKPATFVLDSGAGMNVVTPEAARRLGIAPDPRKADVIGAGGAAASASMARIDRLEVGETKLSGQPAVVIPLPEVLACDGLLGAGFFHQWVVTVDYAGSRLVLTRPGSFTPPPDAEVFPIKLIGETPHIAADADGCQGWFQIDSGAGSALTLFRPFVETNGLRGRYSPSIETVVGRGVGGLMYGDVVRLPVFSIGKFTFRQSVATLSRQTSGAFARSDVAGNLGGEILRRFTITFDYANLKAYMTPNGLYDRPFHYNRTGVAIDYEKGRFLVRAVLPDSPGSEAGVKVNDVILTIDDRPAAEIKPWETGDLSERNPGTKVRLKLRTVDGSVRDVTLTLRDLL